MAAATAAQAKAAAAGQSAPAPPAVVVASSNMREPLLRAAVAAVSGALRDPSALPLREVARRIKAELEALPASLCALASAREAAGPLAAARPPAQEQEEEGARAGEQEAEESTEAPQQDEADAAAAAAAADSRPPATTAATTTAPAAPAAPAPAPAAPAPAAPCYPSAFATGGGAAWQVALGTCFGTAVSFESRGFAHLRSGSMHVVVWRSRDALPKNGDKKRAAVVAGAV
jgi:hypothetical protein